MSDLDQNELGEYTHRVRGFFQPHLRWAARVGWAFQVLVCILGVGVTLISFVALVLGLVLAVVGGGG